MQIKKDNLAEKVLFQILKEKDRKTNRKIFRLKTQLQNALAKLRYLQTVDTDVHSRLVLLYREYILSKLAKLDIDEETRQFALTTFIGYSRNELRYDLVNPVKPNRAGRKLP